MVPSLRKQDFMREKLLQSVKDSIRAVSQLAEPSALNFIESAADLLSECFQSGNKVIIAGNGGSLCDGAHFAEELTGQFREKRRALPAISLSEPGHLSCVANDMGFDFVFSRGVEAFGKAGDVFIALTTSGNSKNILNAFEAAKQQGLATVAFLGKGGGKLKGKADLELVIEGFSTSDRIQEAHMAAIHMIIEMVELQLFAGVLPAHTTYQ
jgi:D-sedoheptulose 7-phosphate isomerase